jgi:hypothetical protein
LVAVLAYVAARSRASLGTILLNISAPSVAAAFFLLLGGAMLASLRLQWVARDLGYSLSTRDAISAMGLGQLAGALFFQIFGQLAARGALLSRRNIPLWHDHRDRLRTVVGTARIIGPCRRRRDLSVRPHRL